VPYTTLFRSEQTGARTPPPRQLEEPQDELVQHPRPAAAGVVHGPTDEVRLDDRREIEHGARHRGARHATVLVEVDSAEMTGLVGDPAGSAPSAAMQGQQLHAAAPEALELPQRSRRGVRRPCIARPGGYQNPLLPRGGTPLLARTCRLPIPAGAPSRVHPRRRTPAGPAAAADRRAPTRRAWTVPGRDRWRPGATGHRAGAPPVSWRATMPTTWDSPLSEVYTGGSGRQRATSPAAGQAPSPPPPLWQWWVTVVALPAARTVRPE